MNLPRYRCPATASPYLFDVMEKLGTIIIMDKEEGDYRIYTKYWLFAISLFEKYDIQWTGRTIGKKDYEFEFNIYNKEELIPK